MSTPATEQPFLRPTGVPLCVDLDGALLSTDVLLEGILQLLRRNPGDLLRLLRWTLQGRSRLRAELAKRVALRADSLPVNEAFLDRLRVEKARGRRLVLCAAAWHSMGESAAHRFGIFDEVVANDDEPDAPGQARARRLAAMFGERGFEYVGRDRLAPASGRRLSAWLRALRLHQWSKNLLVLVPALASHRILDPATLAQAAVAFVSFSLAASGNYLLNDLLDLEADRAHASKRRRALASGKVGIAEGASAAAILITVALLAGGYVLGAEFLGMLAAYLLVSQWYSLALKRQPMVDIMCLAALYTMRIIAGSIATSIEPSFWLLAFSMFLFLSLAAAKRVTELNALLAEGATSPAGRGYGVQDVPLLVAFGVASGYVSVLVMALYVQSGATALYAEPRLLWLVCPVLLYWISRIWLKTYRGGLNEDPVVFALKDRPSLLAAAICALLVVLAA